MSTVTKTRPPAADATAGTDETGDDTAAIAKALGHPARIQIVRLLLEKQSCFGCDMVDEVKLAQSTVSEHLRILKSAGIITGEIERPRVCYSLNAASLVPLAALLNAVFDKDSRGELSGSICCPPSNADPAQP
ncbi:MAG TPA: metalloregulator ArsR/SmtB family transcription factor [Methylomirabilota bacterium]|nr:metalloregulator ArsR/SmtB family transcription factor [Methylomirabilota bacterium]